MRALTAVLASVLVVMIPPGTAAAERTLALSTGTFDFKVATGQTAKGSAEILNSGDEPLEVLVYAGNQVVEDDGTVRYEVPTPGEMQSLDNPVSWIRLDLGKSVKSYGNVPYIEMDPGQRATIDFEFTVPDGVPPGDYQILLFFEMAAEQVESDEAQATVAGRLAARIRVRVEGEVVQRLEIKPFVVRGFVLGNKIPFTLMLQNSGNVDATVDANVTISAASGREVLSVPVLSQGAVYARSNDETTGVLTVPGALIGRYTVTVSADYPKEGSDAGQTEVLTEQRVVWALPLWLAIGVVLVLGGVALWFSWRQAVRSAERKAQERREERRQRLQARSASTDPVDQSTDTE